MRDISLDIEPGAFFGLIGHNGSGKSTLLRLMAGIHRPTHGSITSDGRLSALLELGSGFHPDLTGARTSTSTGRCSGWAASRWPRRWTRSSTSAASATSSTSPSRSTRAACTYGSASRWPSTSTRRSCSSTR
ncbi:MAG: ATP-binding cassette domain-containing protein [Acidimicrobiales bacterium]